MVPILNALPDETDTLGVIARANRKPRRASRGFFISAVRASTRWLCNAVALLQRELADRVLMCHQRFPFGLAISV